MKEIETDSVPGSGRAPRLEQCVPVETVSIPDGNEGEAMAAPEPGDTVRYEVEGKVSRVEGGHAYVDPSTINGQPVQEEGEQQPADEMEGLQAEAAQMDSGPGSYFG